MKDIEINYLNFNMDNIPAGFGSEGQYTGGLPELTTDDSKASIECPYCKKPLLAEMDDGEPYDIYLTENEKVHGDHLDYASHQLELECSTCEGDDPMHCQYFVEGCYDRAKEIRKYGE